MAVPIFLPGFTSIPPLLQSMKTSALLLYCYIENVYICLND